MKSEVGSADPKTGRLKRPIPGKNEGCHCRVSEAVLTAIVVPQRFLSLHLAGWR